MQELKPQPARGQMDNKYWEDPNWTAEKKLNGSRFLAHFEPDRVYMTSRVISKVTGTYGERGLNLPHIAKAIPELVGTVLDGEVVLKDFTTGHLEKVSEVMKIIGSMPEVAKEKIEEFGYPSYVVFDILFVNGKDVRMLPLSERRLLLEKVYEKYLKDNEWIELVQSVQFGKKEFYDWIISQGGEGVVMKHSGHIYGDEDGWVKVKREETYDVIITGFNAPKQTSQKVGGVVSATKYALLGMIGSIQMGMWRDGRLVSVGGCSGMPDDVREEMSKHGDDFIGRVMEIDCQEVTKYGRFQNPRFNRMRPDKAHNECVWLGSDDSKVEYLGEDLEKQVTDKNTELETAVIRTEDKAGSEMNQILTSLLTVK